MKKVNWVKLCLDLAMVIIFVLLFNHKVFSGLQFHEIAGLAIFAAVAAHLLLNLRWVKTVTRRIFDRKLPGRTRFIYILNGLLLVCMAFIVFSGVIISKYLFPGLNLGNEMWFKLAHTSVSFLCLVIIGLHLGLNWSWMMNQLKNLLGIKSGSRLLTTVARLAVIAMLLFGSYQIYTTDFISKLAGLSVLVNPGQTQLLPSRTEGSGYAEGFDKGQMPPRMEGSEFNQTEDFSDRGEGHPVDGKGYGSTGAAVAVLNYLSIMGVWSIITYYLDKLIRWKRFHPAV